MDPLHGKYPELTTYQFASNSPISGIDLDGKEYLAVYQNFHLNGSGMVIKVTTSFEWFDKIQRNNPRNGKMGVEYHLKAFDKTGKLLKSSKESQWRNAVEDYGNFSGRTSIYKYTYLNGNFEFQMINGKLVTDYSLPAVDAIDLGGKMHDFRYDIVNANGPDGLFKDFATIEADVQAMDDWKQVVNLYKNGEVDPVSNQAITRGTAKRASLQAEYFGSVIDDKKYKVAVFMQKNYEKPNIGDRIVNFGDKKLIDNLYLKFRNKYMENDGNGNYRRKEGMWNDDNTPKEPGK